MLSNLRLCACASRLANGVLSAGAAAPNSCALTGVAPLQHLEHLGSIAEVFVGQPAAASLPVQAQQFVSFSAAARQPSREELDLQYRSGVNELWPLTRQQRKLASKVRTALEDALMHDTAFRETLVGVYGFTVQEVRMSPDNMKAFVLWRAYPNCEAAARIELNRRLKVLRAAAAARLQLRHMPRLEMRHDTLTDEQARLEAAMDQIRQERAADAEHGSAEEFAADEEEEGFFDNEAQMKEESGVGRR